MRRYVPPSPGAKRLLIAGLPTEARVSFSALSAVADGYKIFVVGV
jgi:nicotinamidase-related amidase